MPTKTSTPVPDGRAEVVRLYGDPSDGERANPWWIKQRLVRMDLPYRMTLAWDLEKTVRAIDVHELAKDDLHAILREIYDHVRLEVKKAHGFDLTSEQYDRLTATKLREYGLDLYGGCFNYRLKRGGSTLSTHSWGIAIDLDPARNGLGDRTPNMPAFAVAAFEKRGWVWGGRWKGRNCDGMHFQRARGI